MEVIVILICKHHRLRRRRRRRCNFSTAGALYEAYIVTLSSSVSVKFTCSLVATIGHKPCPVGFCPHVTRNLSKPVMHPAYEYLLDFLSIHE